ncbi:MAG: hypothetical protein QM690_21855, partial [Sphingobium sp.]
FDEAIAHSLKYSNNYYINIIRRDDDFTPLSINTRVYPIYENNDPETLHGQTRLLVFEGDHYIYSYNASSESCFVYYDVLRCSDSFEEMPYYDVRISDILARRDIVIGGYDSKAYGTAASRHSLVKPR